MMTIASGVIQNALCVQSMGQGDIISLRVPQWQRPQPPGTNTSRPQDLYSAVPRSGNTGETALCGDIGLYSASPEGAGSWCARLGRQTCHASGLATTPPSKRRPGSTIIKTYAHGRNESGRQLLRRP